MPRVLPHRWFSAIAAITLLFLPACRGNGGSLPLPAAPFGHSQLGQTSIQELLDHRKIKHVVVIIQENRSLNNLFYGYPGARTVTYGYDSKNQKIILKPIGFQTTWDLAHYSGGFLAACNGTGKIPGTHCRMNGFNNEKVTCNTPGLPKCPILHPQYAYVPHDETEPYFDMAHQYVLADEMFASNFDSSSFISHQYIISGQNDEAVNYPDAAWGCSGGGGDKISILGLERKIPDGSEQPCWNPKTLADELDDADLPWTFYASTVSGDGGIWSSYQAVRHIYKGPDWKKDVISPSKQFLTDISSGLGAVTWITPTFENSDHAGAGSKTGPSWVASLVNAIGESKYWNSTAIFIFWDDYGGWYDPQAPTYVDNDGLGLRLPLLIISPYAKKGHVSHVHYEHGSILKFIENQFGLPRLAASDRRANLPGSDVFDFSQPPRKFVPIKAPYSRQFFERQPPDPRPPDTE
jgi:phospholipase C